MPFIEGPKKKKKKVAPDNPERFSTTKAGRRRARSEEKRLKQGVVRKSPGTSSLNILQKNKKAPTLLDALRIKRN